MTVVTAFVLFEIAVSTAPYLSALLAVPGDQRTAPDALSPEQFDAVIHLAIAGHARVGCRRLGNMVLCAVGSVPWHCRRHVGWLGRIRVGAADCVGDTHLFQHSPSGLSLLFALRCTNHRSRWRIVQVLCLNEAVNRLEAGVPDAANQHRLKADTPDATQSPAVKCGE